MTFDDIDQKVWQHVTERHWDDNSSRGLAVSIALEAGELLEHYQWREQPVGTTDDLAEELADIFIYALQFAHINDIDIPTAITAKLAKTAQKYPAEAFQSQSADERHYAWQNAKLRHKKTGL